MPPAAHPASAGIMPTL